MFHLLSKLFLAPIDADLVVCNALLSSCVKAGLPALAIEFYNHMIDEGGLVKVGKYGRAASIFRSEDYLSLFNLLAKMRDLGLLSAKALHALSFDGHAECVQEKYNYHPEAITECNQALYSSSSEDQSDVAASVC
ncbi:hypothetical protein RIF29_27106 [Crotalaria pallida]|uniref:Pentatricopeptide repeat protein n=1 Tax=Crotalaria pallida TaxID=3830 RepID=A0AAN9EVQ3_CROPI